MADISTLGVVGAGTMGHGIAHVAAAAGYKVVLYDTKLDLAEKGRQKIEVNLDYGVKKGKVTAAAKDEALAKISVSEKLSDFSKCELVIEAVPEKMELKQKLFAELATMLPATAILATNTSSLSVTEIASAVPNPERVVGMHFFNPVHLMKLLEVVRAYQTGEDVVNTVKAVGLKMNKELIVVRDSPGFASSRLGLALGMEAIRMLEEGVGSAEDIDRAMELGYGHPMGPLKLTDLIGLDVRLAVGEYLHKELGNPAFRPPQLLKQMVRAGRLGKKVGKGFYSY